ncbi:MAG: DNA integrity scanning protein DisA nucleotide-binding domain protein, partial [Ignavibacteria bacterium]|nr:DNA integrity scanning protein DisA nucleotide-binding domain protein [Ignavibacteria bacterium]
LPLTSKNIIDGFQLGMGHKAGVGITEQSDAISIIVSEETGTVSYAENGILTRGLSFDSLKAKLKSAFAPKAINVWKNVFKDIQGE